MDETKISEPTAKMTEAELLTVELEQVNAQNVTLRGQLAAVTAERDELKNAIMNNQILQEKIKDHVIQINDEIQAKQSALFELPNGLSSEETALIKNAREAELEDLKVKKAKLVKMMEA